MKKHTAAAALALTLALGLSACAPKAKDNETANTNNKQVESKEVNTAVAKNTEDQTGGADQAHVDEAQKKGDEIQNKINDIMNKNKALWDKLFAKVDKTKDMPKEGETYGDFLNKIIEKYKDNFSEEELKTLKEDAKAIEVLDHEATLYQDK